MLGEEFGDWRVGPNMDPIDGTDFVLRRDPNWRIQIALPVGEDIVGAVVDEPANRRR